MTQSNLPKILAVDDRPANLLALETILSKLPVTMVRATSGNEALMHVLDHEFALAIVDIQMPEMNGYELVELLRGNLKTHALPVMFVSAVYADSYHHSMAYESGAVDFLSKPFDPDILLSKVHIFLQLYEQRRNLEQVVVQLQTHTIALEKSNDTLAHRNAQLAIAHEVSRQIASILNRDELATAVVKAMCREFQYELASLWMIDSDLGRIVLQASDHREESSAIIHPITEFPLDAKDCLLTQVCQTKKIEIINNLAVDQRKRSRHIITSMRSELLVPLMVGEKILGVLDILSEESHKFEQADILLLGILAKDIAVSLRNASLYNQVRQFNDELEGNVRERTAELQEAYEELELLDRNKSEFIQIISHELRTPLTLIKAYSQMVLNDKALPDQFTQQIDGILTGAVRMHDIVNTMLDITKIENRTVDLDLSDIDISRIFNEIRVSIDPILKERQLTATFTGVDRLPLIRGDHNLLIKVFGQLLNNAIKYTPNEGNIFISGSLFTENERKFVQIEIKDTGIGIAVDQQQVIFKLLYQVGKVALHSSGSTKFKGGGSGLGLAVAKGIIEMHDGRVWAKSDGHDEEDLPGSSFYVLLPVPQY